MNGREVADGYRWRLQATGLYDALSPSEIDVMLAYISHLEVVAEAARETVNCSHDCCGWFDDDKWKCYFTDMRDALATLDESEGEK